MQGLYCEVNFTLAVKSEWFFTFWYCGKMCGCLLKLLLQLTFVAQSVIEC